METNKRWRTLRGYRLAFPQLTKSFAGQRLGQISPLDVERHKMTRAKVARVRANREVSALKALFNRCIGWELYEGPNPAVGGKDGVQKLEEPRGRACWKPPKR